MSKMDSAVAIGIGVAIAVVVILSAGLGYWIYCVRRGKTQPAGHSWHLPSPPFSTNNAFGSQGCDTFIDSISEDRKRLVGPGNWNIERERERKELPSPTKPIETASVELMGLGGDSGTWGHQTANVLLRVQWPSTSHSTNTTATTWNPLSPPPQLPEHPYLHLNPRSHYERYPSDSRSTHSHMRFDQINEDVASIYGGRGSPVRRPSIKNLDTNWRHQSYKASMKHNSLESNAVFLLGEGEEEDYKVFKWPESKL
jgi:hypothetical protein